MKMNQYLKEFYMKTQLCSIALVYVLALLLTGCGERLSLYLH